MFWVIIQLSAIQHILQWPGHERAPGTHLDRETILSNKVEVNQNLNVDIGDLYRQRTPKKEILKKSRSSWNQIGVILKVRSRIVGTAESVVVVQWKTFSRLTLNKEMSFLFNKKCIVSSPAAVCLSCIERLCYCCYWFYREGKMKQAKLNQNRSVFSLYYSYAVICQCWKCNCPCAWCNKNKLH